MRRPNWEKEKKLKQENRLAIGLDEAGRGPLAGPVVAVACWIEPELFAFWEQQKEEKNICPEILLVRDSKTLSSQQREKVFAWMNNEPRIHFGLGQCSAGEIDRLNILGATILAMRWAAEELEEKAQKNSAWSGQPLLLIDGNRKIKGISWEQETIVSGDAQVFSIAAASILAKVIRDKMLLLFHQEYPQYGFDRHKGYGTQEHYAKLKQFGPCPLHRRSFRLE